MKLISIAAQKHNAVKGTVCVISILIYHQYGNMVVDNTNQQSAVILAEMVPFQVSYSGTLDLLTNKCVTLPQSQTSQIQAYYPLISNIYSCVSK